MCKVLAPEYQLESSEIQRCIRCGELKPAVSARVVEIYGKQVKQFFCAAHASIAPLDPRQQLERRIEQAIAQADSWGRPYLASEVYRLSEVNWYRLGEEYAFVARLRDRVALAVHLSKIAHYERCIHEAIGLLAKGARRPLTVKRILELAGVPRSFYQASERLWRPVHEAIAATGGKVPVRGAALSRGGGRPRKAA